MRRLLAAVALASLVPLEAHAQQANCDARRQQTLRAWGARPHAWIANVFHLEFSGIDESWCRLWETHGTDRRFKAEDFGRNLFTGDGLHPAVGTIVPGSGLAAGAALTLTRASESKPLRFSGTAGAKGTASGFWLASGRLNIAGSGERDDNRHINANVGAARYVLPKLAFFGTGQSSLLANETSFGLTLTSIDGALHVPLPAGFSITGTLEEFRTRAAPATLGAATTYVVPGGGLAWQYPVDERLRGYRTRIGATGRAFHETSGAPSSFTRFEAAWTNVYTPDVERDFGTVTIAARFVGSATRGPDQVPSYLQPTLGGSDINGDAALRSFRDYRFRAPNAAVVQVEYEHALKNTPVGVWIFHDAGQVASGRREFSIGSLRHSTGVGVTLRTGARPLVRLYFAWGGGEGTHTTFTGSSDNLGPAASAARRGVFGAPPD